MAALALQIENTSPADSRARCASLAFSIVAGRLRPTRESRRFWQARLVQNNVLRSSMFGSAQHSTGRTKAAAAQSRGRPRHGAAFVAAQHAALTLPMLQWVPSAGNADRSTRKSRAGWFARVCIDVPVQSADLDVAMAGALCDAGRGLYCAAGGAERMRDWPAERAHAELEPARRRANVLLDAAHAMRHL